MSYPKKYSFSEEGMKQILQCLDPEASRIVKLRSNDNSLIEIQAFFLRFSPKLKALIDGDKACSEIPMAYSTGALEIFSSFIQYKEYPYWLKLHDFEEAILFAADHGLPDMVEAIAKRNSESHSFCGKDSTHMSTKTARIIRQNLGEEAWEDFKKGGRRRALFFHLEKENMKKRDRNRDELKDKKKLDMMGVREKKAGFPKKAIVKELEKFEAEMKKKFDQLKNKIVNLPHDALEETQEEEKIEAEYKKKQQRMEDNLSQNLKKLLQEL